MKNFGKLAVLGAVLAASGSFAFADTIGSYGTGSALGNINTPVLYQGFVANGGTLASFLTNPFVDISSGLNAASVNIGAGTPWANAIAGSTWISYTAGTNPDSGPSTVAPQGYYTFTTTFSEAASGVYAISLGVLADDTTAIFFNSDSTPVVAAGPLGGDGACADGLGAINCETVTNEKFNVSLVGGATNKLTFVVEQTGHADLGLDFSGSIAPAPEPSSLMLLGTGLVGAAGMLFRRRVTA